MLVKRIITIIIFCCSMCYATDYSFEVEKIVTPTNSVKHGITVEGYTVVEDDYSFCIVCRNSIDDLFGTSLPIFSVNLMLEDKTESLSLDVPVQYSQEKGHCRIKFMTSRHAAEFSTLRIYYGSSREGDVSLSLPLDKWIKTDTLGNTQLSSSSNAKNDFSVIECNPVSNLRISQVKRIEFYGLKDQDQYPYISADFEKLFEVDETLRQEDKNCLAKLKKKYPQCYNTQVECIACHRIEDTTYHYPCTCLWKGEWLWDTYKKVFRVEIPEPVMEFDLRDDVPLDNYSNVTNVFRLYAQYFYNSDEKNIKKISDDSRKEMMNGRVSLPEKFNRKQRPIARLLFTARRKYKSKEYMYFVYWVRSDKNPEDGFVKLHVAMFKEDKTRWFFTNELSWSLMKQWPQFANYDDINLPYLPTYDKFRSAVKKSELPSEFYELKSTVTNSIKSNVSKEEKKANK